MRSSMCMVPLVWELDDVNEKWTTEVLVVTRVDVWTLYGRGNGRQEAGLSDMLWWLELRIQRKPMEAVCFKYKWWQLEMSSLLMAERHLRLGPPMDTATNLSGINTSIEDTEYWYDQYWRWAHRQCGQCPSASFRVSTNACSVVT